MKTLGIIGGMGPLATVKLFEKIVLYTDANSDQEHIHTIIDSNTNIPDRSKYILGEGDSPLNELLKSATRLEQAGADFLVMPCNTSHYFYQDIVKSINIPFISMIEETAKYIKVNYDFKKVGLLATSGTYKAKVYENVFKDYEIEICNPSEEEYKYMMELIYNIKMGIFQEDLSNFNSAMDRMKEQGVELFIIGCTEISVAVDMYNLKGNFIDAMDAVAKSAILYSGAKLKE